MCLIGIQQTYQRNSLECRGTIKQLLELQHSEVGNNEIQFQLIFTTRHCNVKIH